MEKMKYLLLFFLNFDEFINMGLISEYELDIGSMV